MNRKETEDELKSTRNTKDIWKWIVGVGIVLMAIAFWGGYFNHDQNFSEEKNTEGASVDSIGNESTAPEVVTDTLRE